MKANLLFGIALSILFNLQVFAQKEIKVISVNKQMSRGMQPGFSVIIPESKIDVINEAYEKRLEDNTKANGKINNGEYVIYGAVNKNISPNPLIMYFKTIETVEGVELTAFVTEDSLTFMNEADHPDKSQAIIKSMHEFAVIEYRKIVTKQLDSQKEILGELTKMLSQQKNYESDNEKEITSKKREIESYKTKIEENEIQQKSKTEQIGNQKKLADGITDKKSPESELAQKNLKKYEGEKKDLEKNKEKLYRRIDENNSDIKNLENEIESLKKQQSDSKSKIENQEAALRKMQSKFDGIK